MKNIEGRLAKLETVAPPPASAPCHYLIDQLLHHLMALPLAIKKELRDGAREAALLGVDPIKTIGVARAEQILADVEAADTSRAHAR